MNARKRIGIVRRLYAILDAVAVRIEWRKRSRMIREATEVALGDVDELSRATSRTARDRLKQQCALPGPTIRGEEGAVFLPHHEGFEAGDLLVHDGESRQEEGRTLAFGHHGRRADDAVLRI